MNNTLHKFLILSCNTGQGHNSAGEAILEELQYRGLPCEMKDTLEFSSQKASKVVSGAYMNIATYIPKFFNALYKAGDFVSTSKFKSVIYLANKAYAENLYKYILRNRFDTIIVPHLFPAEALTYIKRNKAVNLRTFAIATDYTCIPFWEETELDYYFLGHKDLISEFVNKGIPRNKLIATGIPTKYEFSKKSDKIVARKTLNLPLNAKIALIMSGSMGFGNIQLMVDKLVNKDKNLYIIVMCGKNQHLKENLLNRYKNYSYVAPIDFTNNVSKYMDASDIVLTKPGGLTSTEVAVKNLPLVHTPPIPGCETINAKFFLSRGLSITSKDNTALINDAYNLLYDTKKQTKMLELQRKNINPNACKQICNIICK